MHRIFVHLHRKHRLDYNTHKYIYTQGLTIEGMHHILQLIWHTLTAKQINGQHWTQQWSHASQVDSSWWDGATVIKARVLCTMWTTKWWQQAQDILVAATLCDPSYSAANVRCSASNTQKNMTTPEQFFFPRKCNSGTASKTYDCDYKINYIPFNGSL
jgi:N6-adenosine-specific RNA methylase IME4